MKQNFKGTTSTQSQLPPPEPTPKPITKRTHQVFIKITEFSNKIYTNQTGCFPVTSRRGTNNILAETLKSRTGLIIKNAYNKIRQLLISRGLTPKPTFLTMNAPKSSKPTCKKKMKVFNWYQSIYIGVMQPNRISKYGKLISLLASSQHTTNFHYICGDNSSHRPS